MHLQSRYPGSFFRVKEEDNEQCPDDASSSLLLLLLLLKYSKRRRFAFEWGFCRSSMQSSIFQFVLIEPLIDPKL
jgi:hypothetical protein